MVRPPFCFDAVERDPALRDALNYILTDEILSLPAQVNALTDAVDVSETRDLRAGQRLRMTYRKSGRITELRAGQEHTQDGRTGGRMSQNLGRDKNSSQMW